MIKMFEPFYDVARKCFIGFTVKGSPNQTPIIGRIITAKVSGPCSHLIPNAKYLTHNRPFNRADRRARNVHRRRQNGKLGTNGLPF